MASKKLTWLLILQGWTMLWVVIGHAPLAEPTAYASWLDISAHQIARALFSFAYSFHMPLFIMISGYLFYRTRIVKGWKYLDMVKEKWIRLGIPYIFFITVAILIKFCIPGGVNRDVDVSPSGLVMNYLEPFNGALQEMWFVAVIFLYFLLYPLYRYLLKSRISMLCTLVVALGLFFIPVGKMTDFLAINRAVHFFIFFFVGIVISKESLEQYIAKWSVIGVCAVGYVVSYIYKLDPATPLFASIAFWGLAIKADRSLSNNLFHSFRNYTYQIFLIGIFAQIFVKILSNRFQFLGSYPVWWLVCVLAGVYVPVFIARLGSKSGKKYIRYVIGV